ncbi:hypothetical protein C2845_PM13G06310 [Panicum miliaceum]|uniref:RNA-dependent RNA polymerase 6-like second domain-containing protein n=1 Tax=Panicum miliaceum TaxID=4540 RepID=A0A3L6RMM0_PANMI|nr:hypothetical protein C2845_PM13G06310 [Panicum miliaceum]
MELLCGVPAGDGSEAEELCVVLDCVMAELLLTLQAVPQVLASSADLAEAVGALRCHQSVRFRAPAHNIVRGWSAAIEGDVARASAAMAKLDDVCRVSPKKTPPVAFGVSHGPRTMTTEAPTATLQSLLPKGTPPPAGRATCDSSVPSPCWPPAMAMACPCSSSSWWSWSGGRVKPREARRWGRGACSSAAPQGPPLGRERRAPRAAAQAGRHAPRSLAQGVLESTAPAPAPVWGRRARTPVPRGRSWGKKTAAVPRGGEVGERGALGAPAPAGCPGLAPPAVQTRRQVRTPALRRQQRQDASLRRDKQLPPRGPPPRHQADALPGLARRGRRPRGARHLPRSLARGGGPACASALDFVVDPSDGRCRLLFARDAAFVSPGAAVLLCCDVKLEFPVADIVQALAFMDDDSLLLQLSAVPLLYYRTGGGGGGTTSMARCPST